MTPHINPERIAAFSWWKRRKINRELRMIAIRMDAAAGLPVEPRTLAEAEAIMRDRLSVRRNAGRS